jgi:hypothetical protein
MDPLPLPLGLLVIVNHGALVIAIHEHPLLVEIEKFPDEMSDPTDTLAGETVKAQVAAAWEIVTICAPTAIVPLRPRPSGLMSTE